MAQVIAFELDYVESIEENAIVIVPIRDALEIGDPVFVARHRLSIDDAGARAQPCQSLSDQREAGRSGRYRVGYKASPACRQPKGVGMVYPLDRSAMGGRSGQWKVLCEVTAAAKRGEPVPMLKASKEATNVVAGFLRGGPS